jgi:hypothetical protein
MKMQKWVTDVRMGLGLVAVLLCVPHPVQGQTIAENRTDLALNPTDCDYITARGTINVKGKQLKAFGGAFNGTVKRFATFSVTGGTSNRRPAGRLNYFDHSESLHVASTDVRPYSGAPSATGAGRRIEFRVLINGEVGTAVVVVDGDYDTFRITLSNGYNARGKLTRGGVTLQHCGHPI